MLCTDLYSGFSVPKLVWGIRTCHPSISIMCYLLFSHLSAIFGSPEKWVHRSAQGAVVRVCLWILSLLKCNCHILVCYPSSTIRGCCWQFYSIELRPVYNWHISSTKDVEMLIVEDFAFCSLDICLTWSMLRGLYFFNLLVNLLWIL